MEEKIDKFLKDTINKMMEIAGHKERYDDLKAFGDGWYQHFTMTVEQSNKYKAWFVKEILERNVAYSEAKAEKEYMWFNLAYGLRISDPENLKFHE